MIQIKHPIRIFLAAARRTILFVLTALILSSSVCYGDDARIRLSEAEKSWIREHKVVRIRVGTSAPFMFSDGKIEGIAIDYILKIFNDNQIKFKFVTPSEVTWPQALNYISAHDVVDMVPTAKITEERKKKMAFTDEYLFSPWVIFTRENSEFISSIEDLRGKTVAVEEGFVMHGKLKKEYPWINLKVISARLKNYTELPVKAVSTGEVDAYIGNLLSTAYIIQSRGYANVKVAAPTPFEDHNQAMAIRDDWPELVSIINKYLKAMSPDEHIAIRNKWINVRYEYGISKLDLLKWIAMVAGIASLFVGAMVFWNNRLKREVIFRKKIEADLKEAQKIAHLGSFEYIAATRKTEWSEEEYRIYGLDPAKPSPPYDVMLKECIHPDDAGLLHETFTSAVQNASTYEMEHRVVWPDGSVRWVYDKAQPHFDEHGKLLGYIGATLDITDRRRSEVERKELENKLLQAQKMESIGSLAGGIAHDFNNILFPIVGMSELLLEDLPVDGPEYKNVEEVLKAGKRGADLVRQILAFSRQSEHQIIPVRIQQILKEVLKLTRATIPSNIEIIQSIQSDCGLVMADPTQIHQVAMNIITNAFHAIESKEGKISVRLEEVALPEDRMATELKPGKYAKLRISDNGHGIAPDVMNKIFEPYFTTKAVGKGTGLGLSVVYGIIKEYRGDITVESDVGKGTVFNIFLPIMEKEPQESPEKRMAEFKTGDERLLIVDDEESIARIESQILGRLGYNVTFHTNSTEALKAFKTDPHRFDLVITDMTMPGMTGDRLAEEILSVKPDTPIIICTGFSEKLDETHAAMIGVKGFLMKPVIKSDLSELVRKVLDESKNTQ